MESNEHGINESRIVGFSDAVFAFAITLLVLKIDLPQVDTSVAPAQLTKELFALWPQYLANIISFLVIGNYWIIHHKLFSHIKKFDVPLVWLNIFLLMAVSFLPFPTDLMGGYSDQKIAVIFYAANLSIIGFAQLFLWLYASYRRRLIDKNLSDAFIKNYTLLNLIPPLVFLGSIGVAFIDVDVAKVTWILLFLGLAFTKRQKHLPV